MFQIVPVLAIALALLLGAPGSAAADGADAMHDRIEQALQHVLAAGHPARPEPVVPEAIDLQRREIAPGIAHYRFDLQVGAGEHDRIRLHRIVRELAPWEPETSQRTVFLVHGDAWGFEATYLTSLATTAVPDDQNVAAFLAANDMDVWGLGFRWSLVPADAGDLSFMTDWGLGTSIGDLDLGLAVARQVRLVTGNGFARMHLLGWSRGGQIGWAQLGAESQRPPGLRHVRGFVAMDHTFATDDEAIQQSNCASHASLQARIDGGAIASQFGIVAVIGDYAASAPDDPSPFFPILSNADLAEWIGADVAGGAIPYLHSVGGIVDPATFETELLYTQPTHWFAFLSGVSPYQPLRISLDGAAILCDQVDSPYDDHLTAIEVPVLYVGVAGGYGAAGAYTTTQVASTDVTVSIVSQTANPAHDWGHNDLFLADDAAALVWQPVLDWIESH
jgi:hypothetical protein